MLVVLWTLCADLQIGPATCMLMYLEDSIVNLARNPDNLNKVAM
jgi:hypothetical protein